MTWSTKIILSNTLPAPGSVRINIAPRDSIALEIALGQSLGPRGAKSPPLGNLLGLRGCIFQYIPPLRSVRIQYSRIYSWNAALLGPFSTKSCSNKQRLCFKIPSLIRRSLKIWGCIVLSVLYLWLCWNGNLLVGQTPQIPWDSQHATEDIIS